MLNSDPATAAVPDPESAIPRRRPLLIENAFDKESPESFIEQNFRKGPMHKARDAGAYDLDALVAEHGDTLVRSTSEIAPGPGSKVRTEWVTLIFRRPSGSFWHFVARANDYRKSSDAREYTLAVTSADPALSAAEAAMLRQSFIPNDSLPGFFLFNQPGKARRIPIREEFHLSESDLELHYGPGFGAWTKDFAAGLDQSGLTILRGSPGTGKTSFLRHLICSLKETHRFFYIPADSIGLIRDGLSQFLIRQRSLDEKSIMVVVIEDAENILLARKEEKSVLASTLLNFTDGIIGDIVTAHIICTVNSHTSDLDEAVLRPGRQRFFHEFGPIPWERARQLAQRLGVSLSEPRNYTLAEIYHYKDTQTARFPGGESRPIGFSALIR